MNDAYRDAVIGAVTASLEALAAGDAVGRRFQPAALSRIAERLAPLAERGGGALEALRAQAPPEDWAPLHEQLLHAAEPAVASIRGIVEAGRDGGGLERLLRGMGHRTAALEALYPLRGVFPPVARYFVEAPLHDRLDEIELDPDPPADTGVGLLAFADEDAAPGARGGFWLYVPERYDGSAAWPLVVALHGGTGSGRDFLWTWLREARSRRFLLLAPTSRGRTWPLVGADVDETPIREALEHVSARWNVDHERVLLTGLSDGATYTLLLGLKEDSPFTALAPISGVLHPRNGALGNLERAKDRRIYLVHGALDWMFPVGLARMARSVLEEHGADLVYREIDDLPHAYPREENGRILEWLDPALALDPEMLSPR